MRYCINCGNPMGDERFCNQCGIDNAGSMQNPHENLKEAVNIPKLTVPVILNILASVLFVIAAIVLLVVCCRYAQYMSAYSMLYTGSSIFALVYFLIGMWSCIPALMFILNIKKDNSTSVIGISVIMIIIMIAVCLINVIFIKFNGFMKFFGFMAAVYRAKAVTVIVLEVLEAALGIIAQRMSK